MRNNIFKIIKLTAIFLLVAIPFLNCGSPKHSTSSATLSSSDVENLVPQGKALYLQNCASCHGPYDTSDKLGRTQAQIQFAIRNVAQMSHLSGLNTLQIRSLSAALIDQANGGSIIAGPSNRLIFSCQPGSRPQTPLVKLNNREYRNSIFDVLDLFGTSLKNDSQLVDLFNRIPSDIVLELDHTRKEQSFFINSSTTLAAFEAAFRAGALASTSSNLGSFPNTGGCLGQSSISASCHQSFIRELGAIAFRRPLTASEVTTISTRFLDNSLSKSDLIQMTVTGLLQSPDFLYKVYDRGSTITSSANALQITAHEFASKISYFLTGAPPDSTLRNLANSGAILNNSVVGQEVDRLLTTARSRVVIGRLFQESYGYDIFTNLSYPDFYLQGINTSGLQTAMITELDQFFASEITTQNATFSQLLTSRRSQFSNSSLAQIYQSSTGTVELPVERSGFLNRAAFLTKRSGLRASPIKRGLVVLENVLCSSVGLPPPSAPTSLPDLGSQLLSTRDVTHRSTAVPNSSCIACHGRINPLGYAFENFDTLGRVRAVESIYDSSNNLRGQVPVSTNASSNDLGPQPVSYANSVNLSTEIGRSDKAMLCFAQHVKSFESRRPASASDNCHMNDFVNTLYGTNQNQGSIKDAIKNYIISDQFKQWNY